MSDELPSGVLIPEQVDVHAGLGMPFDWQGVERPPDLPELGMDRQAVVVAQMQGEEDGKRTGVDRDGRQHITISLPMLRQVSGAGGAKQG
jgi:hypothetical protein